MDLTPKQQASEAIRQSEAILIVTGQRPNIDQVSSVVALTLILRKFGKKVTTLITDPIPGSANFIAQGIVDKSPTGLRDFVVKLDLAHAEVDKLKYTVEDGKLNITITPFKGGFSPQDVSFGHGELHYDLVIAMGVASRSKLDRLFEQQPNLLQSTPLLNLDFHRINENYGAINLVDTNAATLSEMLISLAESLQAGLLDEPIATAMLTGIIASTDRFSAPHTTAKSMTVAAQLMAAGAKQQQIIKSLYGGGQRDNRDARDNRDGRDNRDRDRRNDRPTPQPTQPVTAPAQAEVTPPAAEPTHSTEAEAKPEVAASTTVATTSSTAPVYQSVREVTEPTQPITPVDRPQTPETDTGPDLASLDWHALGTASTTPTAPVLPSSAPMPMASSPQPASNHQLEAGVTSDLPNEGEPGYRAEDNQQTPS